MVPLCSPSSSFPIPEEHLMKVSIFLRKKTFHWVPQLRKLFAASQKTEAPCQKAWKTFSKTTSTVVRNSRHTQQISSRYTTVSSLWEQQPYIWEISKTNLLWKVILKGSHPLNLINCLRTGIMSYPVTMKAPNHDPKKRVVLLVVKRWNQGLHSNLRQTASFFMTVF